MNVQIPDSTVRDLLALADEREDLDRQLIDCGFTDDALIVRSEVVRATIEGVAMFIAGKARQQAGLEEAA